MTVALEEFAEWRGSVEVRLGKLEAMDEKHGQRFDRNEQLLGAVDRDLGSLHAEFRAQRGLLQALHLTQNEHTRTLSEHSAALRELRTGQEELRQELTEVRVGVQTIIGLLESADGGDR